MSDSRITEHPILPIPQKQKISFSWQGQSFIANEGETIAAALYANGIKIFGHHHKDGSPLGFFVPTGNARSAW